MPIKNPPRWALLPIGNPAKADNTQKTPRKKTIAPHIGIGIIKNARTFILGIRIVINPAKPKIAPEAPKAKISGLPKIFTPSSELPKKTDNKIKNREANKPAIR